MLSWAELISRAGVDPAEQLENFTEGKPADILTLAGDIAEAAGNQRLAADLDQQASAQLAAGYQVNGQPVHDFRAHVEQVKKDLGNSGSNLEEIARRLQKIGNELGDRTELANTRYTSMQMELMTVGRDFTALDNQIAAMNPRQQALNRGSLDAARTRLERIAVEVVRSAGVAIRTSGNEYSEFLDGSLRTLSSMGYVPPDDLGEGPGDVDLTPDAGEQAGIEARKLLDAPPNAESIAALERSRIGLDMTLATLGKDGVPTKEQADYIKGYLNGLGAEGLGKYQNQVNAAAAEATSTLDGSDRLAATQLQPLADGIAAASRFNGGTEMPRAIMTILNEPLGAQTGVGRFANPAGDVAEGVTNLPRYEGLTNLLGNTTAALGTEFAKDLGASAIARKQDLNQIIATQDYTANAMSGFRTDAQRGAVLSGPVDGRISDGAMGRMLQITSRDAAASQALIADPKLRPALLGGAGWANEGGAAAVLAAATDRGQPTAIQSARAAELAKTVIGDVAADPNGWRGLTPKGGQISNALTDIGVQYIDAFGTPRDGQNGAAVLAEPVRRQADGSFEGGFQLRDSDRSGFLRFVASDGPPPDGFDGKEQRGGLNAAAWEERPDKDVQKLHVAADLSAIEKVSEALQRGGSDNHDWKFPLRATGDVNGAIARAEYDALVGAGVSDDNAAKAAHLDRKSAATLSERMLVESVKNVIAELPGGKIAGGFAKDAFNVIFDAELARNDPAPSATATKIAAEWWDETAAVQEGHRTYVLSQVLAEVGMLQDITDPNRPSLPSMVDSNGALRSYRDLVAEGQLPRLRIAAEDGPGGDDFDGWGNQVLQADGTFRSYLPGGGFRSPGVADPLTHDQLMELRYGPGWRSVPELPQ